MRAKLPQAVTGLSLVTSLVLCGVGVFALTASADVPRIMNYQGQLAERDGTPLAGEHTATLRIYDALTGGEALWKETHAITLSQDDRGVFSIMLGSITPFPESLDFNRSLWMSTDIDDEGELVPRQRFAAVGYALNATALEGLSASSFLQLDATGALPAISGASLTNLNASNLASGTVPDTRLPASASFLGSSIGTAELEGGAVTAVKLATDSVGAAALSAVAIQTGDIEAGDLPAHASTHQPGGADALPTAAAVSVGSANAEGSSTSVARADHTHQGLHSLAISGQAQILGDATLAAGSNVTLSQSGQAVTIASVPGNRATTSSTSPVTLGTADTELASVTVTKSQTSSVVVVLASVQLNNIIEEKGEWTVTLKLFRGGSQLDSNYTLQIDGEGKIPSTVHVVDATTTTGSLTYTLKASANKSNKVQATVRRLTVLELL